MRATLLTLVFLAAALWLGFVALAAIPPDATRLPARDGPALAGAKNWGYQLQRFKAAQVPPEIDMLVVDYATVGALNNQASPADVERLRRRPDGTRRIVLCYLSIGEAENYRPYWQQRWSAAAPAWLGPENPAWKGNFSVRYWHPDWQRLIVDPARLTPTFWDRVMAVIFARPLPYIDQIIDAGFDGIYLDRVDAYEKPLERHPPAKSDMVAFVEKIATYARSRRPGFLIVPQNGESLLADPRYRRAIDGVAKEDMLYGLGGDGVKNSPGDIEYTMTQLNRMKAEGRPVFVVEYLADDPERAAAAEALRKLGYIAVFAERGLALPPVIPAAAPAQPVR